MTDTSQDAVKMHLHRLETRGGATDRADAADIIRALTAERDALRAAMDSAELVERINTLSPLFVGSEVYVNRAHVLEWITALSIMREAASDNLTAHQKTAV